MTATSSHTPTDAPLEALIGRHLRIGWWSLLAFLSLGGVLEALHGFKIGWYVDAVSETRRHLWTLGHAHGTLLALVQIGYAATLSARPRPLAGRARLASATLITAGILLPTGFLLGGLVTYGGDPGLGIALVPIGALCLFVGVGCTAWDLGRAQDR